MPTWLFVAGYTVVWAVAGIAAYLGALVAEAIAARTGMSAAAAARIGGVLLTAAGIYQLTPFKNVRLSNCRLVGNRARYTARSSPLAP